MNVSCRRTNPPVREERSTGTRYVPWLVMLNALSIADGDNRLLGAVALHDLKAHIHDPSLARLIIASELMDANFPYLDQDATVAEALQRVMLHDGERIPIVDGHGGRMLVGTISKCDLLLAVGMRK